ncbi:MAG: YncE family protein, partial [Planctomycetota bacterium]|nr:YncE family protein [Planctomycetota bacterium]
GAPQTPHPDDPPDSPLVRGAFVNFESPAIAPLALSEDGSRLYLANTPNNTVVYFDASGPDGLSVIGEHPAGLDPVAIALRPGANEVWVSNRLSDNVTVLNDMTGRVKAVIPIGDEPSTIVFRDDGQVAFIVCEGPPLPGPGDAIREIPGLVAVNAGTKQVISSVELECLNPRAAVYDADSGTVAVAALLSGNNTYVAGHPVNFELWVDPDDPAQGTTTVSFPALIVAQSFSLTAPIFEAGGEFGLGEWPEVSGVPGIDAPVTLRIVPDLGVTTDNPWAEIVAIFADASGDPDPAMVALFEQENPSIANSEEVIAHLINDVKDTLDHDVLIVDVSNPSAMHVPQIVGGVASTIQALARNPRTGGLVAAGSEASNVTRLEPNLRGIFLDHVLVGLGSPANGAFSLQRWDLNAGIPGFNDPSVFNATAHAEAISDPIDIEFANGGDITLVLALGSSRLAALDSATGAVLGRVDVGRGPRGMVVDSGRRRAFVFNRTDHSISTVGIADPAAMTVLSTTTVFNPEPPDVTEGRDFLYSTSFSNLNRTSCASCHVDGKLDGLAWDLGDHTKSTMNDKPHIPADLFADPCAPGNGENHPVKGPMVTQSLQGLSGHEPLHWRGDRLIFEDFNAAFDGLLGGAELTDAQMAAYRDFVMTINYPPTPHREPDNSYRDPLAAAGRTIFINSCDRCHEVTHDGALDLSDECDVVEGDAAFNLGGLFAQVQLVPQLRDIRRKLRMDRYTGAGLIHDGRDEAEDEETTLGEFLDFFFNFNPTQREQVVAFARAWQSNVMPIVGLQTLVTPDIMQQPDDPVSTAIDLAAIDLMITQSALTPSRCDVVAKSVSGGAPIGYHLIDASSTPIFKSSIGETLTLQSLLDLISDGESLLFTAVPPGSGRRIGIDQDNDCFSDGLDPDPQSPRKHPDFSGDGKVGPADLGILLGSWGAEIEALDLDGSGTVGSGDLAEVLGSWGPCP